MGTVPSKLESDGTADPVSPFPRKQSSEPELEPLPIMKLAPCREFLQFVRDYFAMRDRLDIASTEISVEGIRLFQHWGKMEKADGTMHPAFQQRNGRGDDSVKDLEELIVAASLARSSLKSYLDRMMQDFIFLQVEVSCKLRLSPLMDAQTILDQARITYAKYQPGPPFSWMYNICTARIICSTVDDMQKVVRWISQQSVSNPILQSEHNFDDPDDITRYRQLLVNVKVPIGTESWHVCQVTIHHEDLYQFYEPAILYREKLSEYFEGTEGEEDLDNRLQDLETIGGYASVERLEEGFCKIISKCKEEERVARIARLMEMALPPKIEASTKLYEKLLSLRMERGDKIAVADVRRKLGGILLTRGQYSGAFYHLREALLIMTEELGEHDEQTLAVEMQIGMLHECNGKFKKSVDVIRHAMSKAEKALGTRHPLTATAHAQLGSVLRKNGDYTGALDQHELALSTRQAVLGKGHTETASSYDSIGEVMQENGDVDFALKYHRRAFVLRRLNDVPLELAKSYEHLGVLLFRDEKTEQSLKLLKRSLTIREIYYGMSHPLTALSLTNVGLVLFGTKQYEQAHDCFTKALDIRKEVLGEAHPDTAVSYTSVGTALRKIGDMEGAIKMHQRAVELSMITVGNHPQTAVFCCNLGTALAKAGAYDQAIRQYRAATSMRSELLGSQHEDTIAAKITVETLLAAKERSKASPR